MNQTPLSRKRSLPSLCLALAVAVGLLAAAPAAAQPTFSKVFVPDAIGSESATRLIFTIDNAGGPSVSELAFTDILPAGITLADPPSVTISCDGTVSTSGVDTITLTDGAIPAGGSCQIGVDVTASAIGTHTNTSGDLTSTVGNSGPATDDLIVSASRPGFTKSFSQGTLLLGQTTTLTFTIDNSGDDVGKALLSFSDTLPPGLVIAGPSNATTDCPIEETGSLVATPGTQTISYSSGNNVAPPPGGEPLTPLAGGATCTVSVDVTATEPGSKVNRSARLLALRVPEDAPATSANSGFAVDDVEVTVEPITLVKAFVNDPVSPGGPATLRFTIFAFTRDPVTDIAFTDDLDATLSGLVASDLPKSDVCGAGSLVMGTGLVDFSGGSLPAGGSCTFDVTVQVPSSATPGVYPNTTSTVTGDVGGSPTVGSPAVDDLVVAVAPSLTKTVTPDPAEAGDVLTVELLLENNTAEDMTGLAFSDDFQAFIAGSSVVTDPGSGYCNGTGSTAIGATSIFFSSIDLLAGASCTFSFTLQVPLDTESGVYTNTTSQVTGTAAMTGPVAGNPASDDVTILAAPTLTKDFEDPVAPGGTVTLRFTLTTAEGATGPATDIAFTDDLSAVLSGLVAIDTPIDDVCGAGSQISGTDMLTFTGGTLAPNSSCTFSVTLQVPAGAAPGSYPNTTSDVTATSGGIPVESAPATDNLDVSGLILTKQFTDDPAVPGGPVTLQFTLRNDDPVFQATGIAFTDNLNAALTGLAYTGGTQNGICGMGSQITAAIPTLLSFTGGSLDPGASCTFSLVLDVPAGAAPGLYFNTTSSVVATVDGEPLVIGPASDTLTVVDPLSIEKEFTDDPVLAGGTVTLELTLTNAHPTEAATGVAFTDDLDAALTGLVATGTPIMGCGGTLSGTDLLTFTGGTVAAASSCTLTVTLQVPAALPSGTIATNTTSSVTGTIDGVGVSGDPASDDLRVEVAAFTKSFDGPTTATGTAVLTFTLENLNDADGLAGLGFTDDLNAALSGLVATGTPFAACGGTVSGTSLLTFSGGSLGPGASCSFDVTVLVPADAVPGTYSNTTSALTSAGLEVATPASADLVIEPPPTFAKSFAPAVTGVGVPSTLTFTINNTASALAATGLDFTDNLPAGVTVATPADASTTCTGGTLTATEGSATISYTGGTVAAGAICTVQADVVAASTGSFMNTSGELTSSSGGSGTASSTLTVRPAPTVTKTFSPDVILLGGISTVTVTIDNSANMTDATNVTFLDALPAGVVVAATPNASTTCTGGTLTANPGAGSFSYNGGTVPGGMSCQVSVNVTAAAAGSYDNSVTVSSSLGTGAPASDTLEVVGTPVVSKAFSPSEIEFGATTTVIVTIDNSGQILPATGLSFTDMLPAGVTVASPVNASTDCSGGTLTAVAGEGSFSYSGGSVAAGAVCAVMVEVTAGEVGPAENLLVVDSSLGQSAEASAVLVVRASLAAIPTAGTWGLLALGLLLAAGALWRLRF